jgi:hypothetical protein
MKFAVRAVSAAEFEQWLASQPVASPGSSTLPSAPLGAPPSVHDSPAPTSS